MIETRPQKTVAPRLRDNLGYHGVCQLTCRGLPALTAATIRAGND
jgi:hypothetical protein